METFVTICTYLELLTFLVSLITLKKYKHTPLKYLPIWLGLIVAIEFYCFYFYRVGNVWLHNFLSIFDFYFVMFLLKPYLNINKRKWWVAGVSIYTIFTLVNVLFGIQNIWTEPISYSYVLSYFLIIMMITLLLYQKLKNDAYEEGYTKNLIYWICFGLLLFYSTVLPINSITNWVEILGEMRIYLTQILIFAILTKNIIFISGFICCKKMYSY